MTRKDFQSHLPSCWQWGWYFQNETTKIRNYFSNLLNFRCQCFRYPDHVCLCYSLLSSGLIEIKRKSFDCTFFACPYARMPVYHVLFRSKFSSVSSHIINAYWPNLVGPVRKIFGSGSWRKDLAVLGPSVMISSHIFFPSGPTARSTSAQYFGFVRHTFITHDVIEHEKWKVLFFF